MGHAARGSIVSNDRMSGQSDVSEREVDTESRSATASGRDPRILVIDDNRAIHDDFRKILTKSSGALEELAESLFGARGAEVEVRRFDIDTVAQGDVAVSMVERALAEGRPYEVAFVDMRMPPGPDGIETVAAMWALDPRIEVVLCTAFSDYSSEQLFATVGATDQLLILRKPFEVLEVRQLAHALASKWQLAREHERRLGELEALVAERARALAQANEQLTIESAERAASERALRQAQRLEVLGRLAADIGCEIKNPLTFVMAGIETLEAEFAGLAAYLPAAVKEEIERMLESASIGADRIDQIVRSIEMVGQPSERPIEVVDMRAVAQLALRMAESELGDDIEVTTELDEVPPVLGKRVPFEQVLINLIQNAAHATREAIEARRVAVGGGGSGDEHAKGRISIRCHVSRRRHVVVDVTDTGVGISAANIDKIFDPFFTTKPVNQGSGLGLSICHAIVREHGGEIDVESVEGSGTTISVRLPVARLGSPELAALLPAVEEHQPSVSGLRGRILVVDDEPLITSTLTRALRTHDVVGVLSGSEALARCADEPFDLILCDLMLPGMSGMELYEQLSDTAPGMAERIVFMTGASLVPKVQKFLAGVGNECLGKPLSMRQLQPFVDARVRAARESAQP